MPKSTAIWTRSQRTCTAGELGSVCSSWWWWLVLPSLHSFSLPKSGLILWFVWYLLMTLSRWKTSSLVAPLGWCRVSPTKVPRNLRESGGRGRSPSATRGAGRPSALLAPHRDQEGETDLGPALWVPGKATGGHGNQRQGSPHIPGSHWTKCWSIGRKGPGSRDTRCWATQSFHQRWKVSCLEWWSVNVQDSLVHSEVCRCLTLCLCPCKNVFGVFYHAVCGVCLRVNMHYCGGSITVNAPRACSSRWHWWIRYTGYTSKWSKRSVEFHRSINDNSIQFMAIDGYRNYGYSLKYPCCWQRRFGRSRRSNFQASWPCWQAARKHAGHGFFPFDKRHCHLTKGWLKMIWSCMINGKQRGKYFRESANFAR